MTTSSEVAYDSLAMLRSALVLAARGWRVFPCAPGEKRPALRGNWQQQATTDGTQLRAWWARAPYNIGIDCGTSLVVIDLDVASPGSAAHMPVRLAEASGARALAALCQQHSQPYPVPTFAVDTPSGGRHLYYQADPGARVKNSAGRLGPLIDIRADGGYVLGAGSRIADRVYTARDRRPPAPLPRWLAALLSNARPPATAGAPYTLPQGERGTAYAMAALGEETRLVAAAQPGTRNDVLNRAAFSLGQLVAAGLIPSHAVSTALSDAARQVGLPDDEARRTISSGMTAGGRKPRAR